MFTVAERRASIFLLVATSAFVTSLLTSGLKIATDRDRPPVELVEPEPLLEVPTTSSFPSGHASSSFASAVVLGHLVPPLRWPLLAVAAAIAFSRVYVGVHYPLDVLAGALLGAAVATALLLLVRALQRSLRSPTRG